MTDEERERTLRRINDQAAEAEAEGRRVRDEADYRTQAAIEASRRAKRDADEAESQFFPPDVSLRVVAGSDPAAAQGLFPAAKQLLFRASAMKDAGVPVVKLFQPGPDGSLIYVYLIENLKHVYVQPGKVSVKEQKEEKEVEKLYNTFCPDMLTGVVYPGSAVLLPKDNPDDPDRYTLHEFHPSAISAAVYELNFAWQDLERLAVESDPDVSSSTLQAKWPKPSMYSGAMKRVVQAIYGIGQTSRPNEEETANEAFDAQNHYDYRWARTDGIHRVGDEIWLIRIDREQGVLATPLPVFKCSAVESFAAALEDIGDTETLVIVNEFGGLPSGETFSTGADLEATIASGDVYRLLTANELSPFYYRDGVGSTEKAGFFEACGWAFSNSGAAIEVHNTCHYYSREDIAFATWWEGGWYLDGFADAPAEDRFMRAEHWKITLHLDPDDIENPLPSAELELVEMQPLEAPNCFGLNSYVFTPKLAHFVAWDAFIAPGNYIEFDAKYTPFGGGIYGGPVDLGYGFGNAWSSPRTQFRMNMNPVAPDDHSSGTMALLPFRSSYTTITPDGHQGSFTAITGPGQFTIPESPRLSNGFAFYGFNPLDYVDELRTVFVRENPTNPAYSHALYWTHSALMLVPQASDSSTLQRFTFWGRSEVGKPLDEMEPAYPAPVLVFYIGENLEIVRRQAERWIGGHYTMGDFWATSLDLRMNSDYQTADYVVTGTGAQPSHTYRHIVNRPEPEGHIGLIIPQGVREGYVLLRSAIGFVNEQSQYSVPSLCETKPVGVFAVNSEEPKIIEFTNYAWDGVRNTTYTLSGDHGTEGLYYEVWFRWYWYWTGLYAGAQIKMSIAINAQTGEFFHVYDGPMRDWNPFDLQLDPFFWPEYVVPPKAVPRDGYPRFRTNMPPGIVLPDETAPWGPYPEDITFIGGI